MDVSALEPLLPEDRQELEDLATDLVAKANTLAGRLHPVMRASMGDLVRSMTAITRTLSKAITHYRSTLIGHSTTI